MAKLPWWARISAKILLSRLPISYAFWAKLGIFRHGRMDELSYAGRVFNKHLEKVGDFCDTKDKGVLMEIGPGDSMLTAAYARAAGFKGSILIDAGRFASEDIQALQQVTKSKCPDISGVDSWSNLDDALKALNCRYLTNGLAAFEDISDQTIDFSFSQAVLEHIRKYEYSMFMKELKRVTKTGQISSHRVDLKDHLGGGLNNLRFEEKIWESDSFAFRSGFYTNRFSYDEHIAIWENAGWDVSILNADRWQEVPIEREKLASEFKARSDSELLVSGFDVILS